MKHIVSMLLVLTMLFTCGVALTEGKDATHAVEDYESLSALTEKAGFKLGAPISFWQMFDAEYQKLVVKHFSSITATNELKAYSLLDQKASKQSADGSPEMNYRMADAIVKFAQDNGIGVRGHVLVWDAYMTDWFFRENYDSNAAYADRATMVKRMEQYITKVVTHFEEAFPGVVYCWDVVNEAVGDSASEYIAGDDRHLRTVRSGTENPFYKHVGDDYVNLAFLYAKNTVDALGADIKLYYNDYNAFMPEKRDAIGALVLSVNSYVKNADGSARRLCDGVGMQGYIGGYGTQSGCMNESNIEDIANAIERYSDLGLDVQITEMAVRNFVMDEANIAKHAAFYQKLTQAFIDANQDGVKLSAVSIWGLVNDPTAKKDSYNYRLNSPGCGLFDENYAVTPAFTAVYDMLKGH